jgi:hypothetical protein
MTSKEEMLRIMGYSDEIMKLFDEFENLTTSDFQACLDAIVMKIIRVELNLRKVG